GESTILIGEDISHLNTLPIFLLMIDVDPATLLCLTQSTFSLLSLSFFFFFFFFFFSVPADCTPEFLCRSSLFSEAIRYLVRSLNPLHFFNLLSPYHVIQD
ncbi:unnamed protein product, partial [Meganyctiphanes norvegica]